jgi:hypothetical protein
MVFANANNIDGGQQPLSSNHLRCMVRKRPRNIVAVWTELCGSDDDDSQILQLGCGSVRARVSGWMEGGVTRRESRLRRRGAVPGNAETWEALPWFPGGLQSAAAAQAAHPIGQSTMPRGDSSVHGPLCARACVPECSMGS